MRSTVEREHRHLAANSLGDTYGDVIRVFSSIGFIKGSVQCPHILDCGYFSLLLGHSLQQLMLLLITRGALSRLGIRRLAGIRLGV